MARHYVSSGAFVTLAVLTTVAVLACMLWIGLADQSIRNSIDNNVVLRQTETTELQGRIDEIEMNLLAVNFTTVETGVCSLELSTVTLIDYELVSYQVGPIQHYYIKVLPPSGPLPATSTGPVTSLASCAGPLATFHQRAMRIFDCSVGTTNNPFTAGVLNGLLAFSSSVSRPVRPGEAAKMLLDGTTPATMFAGDLGSDSQCYANQIYLDGSSSFYRNIWFVIVGSTSFSTVTWSEPLQFVLP